MTRVIAFVLSVMLYLAAFLRADAADIRIAPSKTQDGVYDIYITGLIETGDSERFIEALKSIKKTGHRVNVVLDSEGGMVLEAGRIGSLIRDGWMTTQLGRPDGQRSRGQPPVCYSACGLIFFAGVKRRYHQDDADVVQPWRPPFLGLHSPYIDNIFYVDPDSEAYEEMTRFFVDFYIAEMERFGAPAELVERSLEYGEEDLLFVTRTDIDDLVDRFVPDVEIALAAACGRLTGSELRVLRQTPQARQISPRQRELARLQNTITTCEHREIAARQAELISRFRGPE